MSILDELKKQANGKADSANNIAEAIALMNFSEGGVTPEEIAESVSAYLDEHLTNPTNPPIDTSLSISGAAADAKETGDKITQLKEDLSAVEEVAFSEQIVIDMTDTADLEEPNQIRRAHQYAFEEGKKYRLEVTINNGTFQSNQSHALLAQTSRATNEAVTGLNTTVLDLVNTASSQIIIGHTYSAEFTALSTDKNILIRYKIESGSFTATVKCYEIGITIKTELADIERKVDTNNATLTRNSRMQMGAHRGAEHYAPPNSVAAYEIAGKMGFPWAWIAQIRWSVDGTLYAMHDADVSITTNGTGNIQDLTDEYISGLLCNKSTLYDYSKFTDDDLRVPTLEKVIQICLRYGMKMCFRIEPFPNQIETELHQTIWDNFERLVKEYGISADWCCYSGYNVAEMVRCITLFGEDAELCPFLGTVSAQNVVDWFNAITSVTVKRKSVLLSTSNLTLADIKLLHSNGIKVYAFTNSTTPTQEQMEQLAYWGVDILQNPRYARIPVV